MLCRGRKHSFFFPILSLQILLYWYLNMKMSVDEVRYVKLKLPKYVGLKIWCVMLVIDQKSLKIHQNILNTYSLQGSMVGIRHVNYQALLLFPPTGSVQNVLYNFTIFC